jgi:hypothetical protein
MSRSVHTRPSRILAPDRVHAPYERRGARDLSRKYRLRALDKKRGIPCVETPSNKLGDLSMPLPRVHISRLPNGWCHPLTRSDVDRLLQFFGPEVTYGLRSIDLVQSSPGAATRLRFGTLVVPGQIRLFSQPVPPWTITGVVSDHELQWLTRASAVIQIVGEGLQTIVDWPGNTLCEFFMFDVLMHEVGHHIVQQYTGKRRGWVRRTKDHEAFADRFARRCRREYTGS